MAKCFMSGVEITLDEAYVIDRRTAYRALLDLRHRAMAVERVIQQLSPVDEVEIFFGEEGAMQLRKRRRLITANLAENLANIYPQEKLFLSFADYRSQREQFFEDMLKPVEEEKAVEVG